MITLLVVLVLVAVLHAVSPRLAAAVEWLVTLGFLMPFFTLAGGSLAWALINLFTGAAYWSLEAWLWCCTSVGLPLACVVGWFILTD